MDIFKWVVTGLLSALVVGVGWLLSDIRTDLRDVRKEVVSIRIEAATTNTKLEAILDDARRRSNR
jgi:hypothetical protein